MAEPPPPLRLIIDAPGRGAENMRRDIELLELVADHGAAGAVRLYGFAPQCLSLGRFQPEEDIDLEACARDGIEVVRRPTGGRAVLHAAEVTYSVTCSIEDPDLGGDVLGSCARIHVAVARGLDRIGVVTWAAPSSRRGGRHPRRRDAGVAGGSGSVALGADCFARASSQELVDVAGRKLVGSAQARRRGALLQHGSILLEAPDLRPYLRSPGPGDGPGPSLGVHGLLRRALGAEAVMAALVAGFRETLGPKLSQGPS